MTKVEVNAAHVAASRREGLTWQQVRERFGVKLGSGPLTERLNEAGFDAAGLRLDGKGPRESKARVANGEGGGSKPKASKSRNGKAKTKRGSRRGVTTRVDRTKTDADKKQPSGGARRRPVR
jgi:hypothetical protein